MIDPAARMKEITVIRSFCVMVGVLFIAYALFGYLSDKILIFSGKGRGVGPQYAHGEQALLAALGYVSFAVAAFIVSRTHGVRSAARPVAQFSHHVVIGIVFILVGIVLVGFRTPG